MGISGLVTDINNTPILGALVVATNPSDRGVAHTNYYGEYFIKGISPGFYEVSAFARGFVPVVYPDSVEVIENQVTTNIDFTLIPLDTTTYGGIVGTITDATTGNPIPYAQIYASGPNGQGQSYSNSFGSYLLILVQGTYEVRVAAYGYSPATYPESVVVNSGQITKDIDFALTTPVNAGIAGFIIDGETGLTIPDARITATGPSGTVRVKTDENGDYLVDDLQQGIYYLDIDAAGYAPVRYPDAILVMDGWITPFVCPVLCNPYSVNEQSSDYINRISLNVYPNPFTQSSQISWQVHKETRARLRVFDATGRVVKNLLDTSLQPGSYSLTWDGTDNYGNAAARGVYFYKFETDESNATVKTIFLK
jgi:hypothetical protein